MCSIEFRIPPKRRKEISTLIIAWSRKLWLEKKLRILDTKVSTVDTVVSLAVQEFRLVAGADHGRGREE